MIIRCFPRSDRDLSVLGYCGLLVVLFCLPLVTSWIGHPSREQAYAGLSNDAGALSSRRAPFSGKCPMQMCYSWAAHC